MWNLYHIVIELIIESIKCFIKIYREILINTNMEITLQIMYASVCEV